MQKLQRLSHGSVLMRSAELMCTLTLTMKPLEAYGGYLYSPSHHSTYLKKKEGDRGTVRGPKKDMTHKMSLREHPSHAPYTARPRTFVTVLATWESLFQQLLGPLLKHEGHFCPCPKVGF